MTRRKLYRVDLAELAGVAVNSLYRLGLPERDGTDIEAGKARPYWWPATAQRWLAGRRGKGWRAGQLGTHAQRRAAS